MGEWKEVAIGDIAILKNGKKRPNVSGSIPVYGGNGIMDYVDSYNDDNCIAIGRVGAYCGCVYLTKGKVWISDNAISAKANQNVNNVFLYYLLGSLNLNRHRIGGAQPLMTQDLINRIRISLPPIKEQQKIASILSSLDSKIENNRKICANLEAQAQALFKHWFIDFAPFKDGKFVESELGMIPEGWRVGTFTEIFNLCPGGTPKTSESSYWENGNIPFFSPKDVTGIYCFKTEKQITKEGLNNCSSRLYDTNTVLITCRGTVGKVTMSAVPMAMNQSNYAILAKEGYSQYYAYLMTVAIVRKLKFKAVGSVFDAITSKDFNEKIIIPDFATLKSFDSLISTFFEEIKAIGFESSRLTTLRDTLLPKLMSGEIKV